MSLNFSNLVFWSDPKDERNNNQIPLESAQRLTQAQPRVLSRLWPETLDPGFRRGDREVSVAPVG